MVFIILCRASQKLVIVIFVLTRLWSEPDMVMEKIKLTVKLFCSTNCLGWPSNPGQPKGRSRSSLVELLFIELMSHLSHVMYTQPIHLTHELLFCIQITRGRVLVGIKFWACDLQTKIFFDLQPNLPYMIWPFSLLHMAEPRSSGQYSQGPFCSSCQLALWNTVQTFPEPVRNTWSSLAVSRPSSI